MRLYVEAEDTQQKPATIKPAMELSAVPVSMFGSHVERNHIRNNRASRDEYEVRMLLHIHIGCSCDVEVGVSITVSL